MEILDKIKGRGLLIILLLILSGNAIHAQHRKTYDCAILKEALNYAFIARTIPLGHFKDTEIVVIDTNCYFKDCELPEMYSKKITTGRKLTYNLRKLGGKDALNKIVVVYVHKKWRAHIIMLWQPCNNSFIILEMIKRKRKYYSNIISMGEF